MKRKKTELFISCNKKIAKWKGFFIAFKNKHLEWQKWQSHTKGFERILSNFLGTQKEKKRSENIRLTHLGRRFLFRCNWNRLIISTQQQQSIEINLNENSMQSFWVRGDNNVTNVINELFCAARDSMKCTLEFRQF